MDLIEKFIDCFPSISFDICKAKQKHQLSIESVTTGEREIIRMLNEAQRDLSKIKKLHKKGKASSEELFDFEWRVNELEQELEKFNEEHNIDKLDSDIEDETV
jgi:multidrug resistance efflux pump